MSLRQLIVDIDTEGLNVREFCAQHGISTWLFYELRRRASLEGRQAALQPRSRAPRRVANRTSPATEDAIVTTRKDLLDAGLDAGPGSVAHHLQARGVSPVPSEATIWRVLRRRGFITPDPSKAPKRPQRRFVAERANELWQADDTHWPLADGTTVCVINIIDDCTRTLMASRAAPTATAAAIFAAFTTASTCCSVMSTCTKVIRGPGNVSSCIPPVWHHRRHTASVRFR
jgi:transposase InsO family protein